LPRNASWIAAHWCPPGLYFTAPLPLLHFFRGRYVGSCLASQKIVSACRLFCPSLAMRARPALVAQIAFLYSRGFKSPPTSPGDRRRFLLLWSIRSDYCSPELRQWPCNRYDNTYSCMAIPCPLFRNNRSASPPPRSDEDTILSYRRKECLIYGRHPVVFLGRFCLASLNNPVVAYSPICVFKSYWPSIAESSALYPCQPAVKPNA